MLYTFVVLASLATKLQTIVGLHLIPSVVIVGITKQSVEGDVNTLSFILFVSFKIK